MSGTTYTEAQYSTEAGRKLILSWLSGRSRRDVDHCARYLSRQLRVGTLPECRALVRGAIAWDERPRWALVAVDLPAGPAGTRGYFEVVDLDEALRLGSEPTVRRAKREECVEVAKSLAPLHWDEVVQGEEA